MRGVQEGGRGWVKVRDVGSGEEGGVPDDSDFLDDETEWVGGVGGGE